MGEYPWFRFQRFLDDRPADPRQHDNGEIERTITLCSIDPERIEVPRVAAVIVAFKRAHPGASFVRSDVRTCALRISPAGRLRFLALGEPHPDPRWRRRPTLYGSAFALDKQPTKTRRRGKLPEVRIYRHQDPKARSMSWTCPWPGLPTSITINGLLICA